MHPEHSLPTLMLPQVAQPPPPSFHHEPVLVDEVLSFVPPEPGLLVDCTVGGGGHAEALLREFPGARLFGCDRDAEAVAAAGRRGAPFLARLAEKQAQARQMMPDSSGVLKSLLPPEADDGDIAYGGIHRWSETPSSKLADIFTPAPGLPLQRVRFM